MALFGEESTSSLHGSTLFGSDRDHPVEDPWSNPSHHPAGLAGDKKSNVSQLLSDVIVPESYSASFNEASPVAGSVSVDALRDVLGRAELSAQIADKIVAIISQGNEPLEAVDRGSWNVALALAGFSQRGSDELNLDLVDFSRNCKFALVV